MGEVLSQQQIDSLLNAIHDDKTVIEEMEKSSDDKKVRVYNFRSPKKFTKDRIRLLDNVYDNYARAIGSYISTLLRYGCEIKVTQVEEERYAEFSNALNDNDVVSLLSVSSQEDPMLSGNILIQISKQVAFNIMDRSLGGTGEEYVNDKNFTDIELSIYNSIIKHIAPKMDDVWHNHLELSVEFERSETNPSLVQVIGIDEVVIIIVLEIALRNSQGIINICIPTSILESLFKLFDKNKLGVNKRKDMKQISYQDEILDSIRTSELDVSAVLGKTTIQLMDLYDLQVGDVIQIDKNKEADVELYIGEKLWFEGSLGTIKNNLAVKINTVNSDIVI